MTESEWLLSQAQVYAHRNNIRWDRVVELGHGMDGANFVEHVVVDKNAGFVRRVMFTPDDPEAFKAALEGALASYRERVVTAG